MTRRHALLGALAALAALASSGCASEEVTQPSPGDRTDWRDQIIYFVMIDRFNDGDPTNNDQGASEYDPKDEARYSGGDLQGVIDKLDYIQGLGATAVWITPPVANQWWDPMVNFSGYHGYWAENFDEVDRHYGDLATYQSLARALHDRKMLLTQDIVVNHTGNFFRCASEPQGEGAFTCEQNTGSKPVTAPTQPPFDKNDPASPEDRAAAIYHFTPPIGDFKDLDQRFTYQLSDLDDLNTENPEVMNALKGSYNHWIKDVGVDSFRIDTVIYTPPETYADFLRSTDPAHPGVEVFAESVGKPDFFSFGEAWIPSTPYDDAADRSITEYIEKDGQPLIDSALNFPLHFDLQSVFAQGSPTRQLSYRLEKAFSLYKDPARLLNFVDNHDRPRFLTIGSPAALKQALMFILTIPGIPVIYYGTEQSFTDPRAAMFAGGVQSGGVDHFDADAAMYGFLKSMIALRSEHEVFRRGAPRVFHDNGVGPGVLAYTLEHEGQTAVVLFNTSEDRVLLDGGDVSLPEGSEFKLLFTLSPASPVGDSSLVVGEGGKLVTALEPRAGMVLLSTGKVLPLPPSAGSVTLDFPADAVFSSNPTITGTMKGASSFLLVIDGNLSEAQAITAGDNGAFSAVLPVENMRPDPSLVHRMAIYVEDKGAVLLRRDFRVNLTFTPAAEVLDPDGDDRGPAGTYAYPTDETYKGRYGDIRKVAAARAGNNLKLSLTMNDVSVAWNPVFGFDHVSFSVYIDVPGEPGVAALPFQNASAPDGMQWDRMALTGGWINALYTPEGASATSHGASVSPAAEVSLDAASDTIELLLSPESLGKPATLSGARIYVTTWDYDGGYRPLVKAPEQWKFSGGDGAVDPLILDDALLEIP